MKRKKEMHMQHGDESNYLNQQHDHSYPEHFRRRNFITDSSDINNNFSVIYKDTFPALIIENILNRDILSDGILNLNDTPNAKLFKMTIHIETRKYKRASGDYFD